MATPNSDQPRGPLRPWRKGDDLSARHFQEPVDAIKSMTGGVGPVNKIGGDKISFLLTQFRVKTIQDDFITCVSWDGEGEGQSIQIAKPFLLRKTPIDFITSEGYIRTLPNGRANKYNYLNTQKRKAENIFDSEDTEIQVIVPAYVEDDLIYCAKGVRGGLDAKNDATDQETLFWIDMNNDGRAWAKADDQDDES